MLQCTVAVAAQVRSNSKVQKPCGSGQDEEFKGCAIKQIVFISINVLENLPRERKTFSCNLKAAKAQNFFNVRLSDHEGGFLNGCGTWSQLEFLSLNSVVEDVIIYLEQVRCKIDSQEKLSQIN